MLIDDVRLYSRRHSHLGQHQRSLVRGKMEKVNWTQLMRIQADKEAGAILPVAALPSSGRSECLVAEVLRHPLTLPMDQRF